MQTMRLLAIDVGAGTQDIFLYDSNQEIGNSVKAVLPSQSNLMATEVEKHTHKKMNIVVYGETMGGYPFGSAIKKHLAAGLKVAMTSKAARTLRDKLDVVKAMNIDIISDVVIEELIAAGYSAIKIGDLNLASLEQAFAHFGISFQSIDYLGVAVQDHGNPPIGVSERVFRFENLLKPGIDAGGDILGYSYLTEQVPNEFTRMCAVARLIMDSGYKGLVMDTGPAVLFGALEDEYLKTKNVIGVLNFGNQHTLGGIFDHGRLIAVYEHHTGLVSGSQAEEYLFALADGTLTNEEIFENHGHGAYTSEVVGSDNLDALTVLGPQKHTKLLSFKKKFHHAAPFGDQMMAGPAGLVVVANKIINQPNS